jgi:hypothetical protein
VLAYFYQWLYFLWMGDENGTLLSPHTSLGHVPVCYGGVITLKQQGILKEYGLPLKCLI